MEPDLDIRYVLIDRLCRWHAYLLAVGKIHSYEEPAYLEATASEATALLNTAIPEDRKPLGRLGFCSVPIRIVPEVGTGY